MSVLSVGFGDSASVDTGDITKSLRFRASGSTYMSRTPGSAGNRKTLTWSGWVKRGALGSVQILTSCYSAAADASNMDIGFYADDTLRVVAWTTTYRTTTQVFRGPSAHYHILVVVDTTQATANDRVKLFINGTQVTAFATTNNPALNADIGYNQAATTRIGSSSNAVGNLLDGYLSRICFVDGQALTPSSFGYLNTEINEWVTLSRSACKAVVDAGGTNSFMLDFEDGTSLTTLGNDYSAKNNDWTLTNHSLTAGVTYDWMEDRPGNSYAVLNPLYPSAANITNGNLSSGTTAARATMNSTAIDSQWFVTAGASAVTAGVIDDSGSTNTTTVTANKVFGFKMTAAGALSYKNVTDAGSWTSIATGLTGNRWPYSVTQAASWNFGQQPLPEALDTGFLALCQANLPEGAVRNPKKHFGAKTQLGSAVNTGANLLAQFTEFTADFAWGKDRAAVNNHQLVDTVRGNTAILQSNTTAAETTYTAPTAGDNCVAWGWKANGAAVSNTDGTITSQVSANQTAGFSIVTYTGTGANATVGHGLGVAPKMVIVKGRTTGSQAWLVWHTTFLGTEYIQLSTTAAKAVATAAWNSTVPTSSVFSLGTSPATNNSGSDTYITYCFTDVPGYQKIGSFSGNSSTDGPYVHLGFAPRFLMIKRTDVASDWWMYDSLRPGYNVINTPVWANLATAEGNNVAYSIDLTGSGFKWRTNTSPLNQTGGTYIYIAIADTNGKYSNGR